MLLLLLEQWMLNVYLLVLLLEFLLLLLLHYSLLLHLNPIRLLKRRLPVRGRKQQLLLRATKSQLLSPAYPSFPLSIERLLRHVPMRLRWRSPQPPQHGRRRPQFPSIAVDARAIADSGEDQAGFFVA